MPNWGTGTSGALGGAAAGAYIGSVVPGIGTAIGAGLGGLAGGLGGLFGDGGGRKDKLKTFQKLTPQQQALQQQIIQALMGGQGMNGQGQNQFSDLFGQFNPQQATNAFQQGVTNPAMRNWNQNIVPGIQERFADQGYSSGLFNSLAAGGRDLQEGLNNQMSPFLYQAMMQNQNNRLGGLNTALGTQNYTPYIEQGNPGMFNGFNEGISSGLGQQLGSSFLDLLRNDFQGQNAVTPNANTNMNQRTRMNPGLTNSINYGTAGR